MKKQFLLISAMILLLSSISVGTYAFKLRPMFSAGYTSVESGVLNNVTGVSDKSKFNYGGKVQALFDFTDLGAASLSLGGEIGYNHLWGFKSSNVDYSYDALNFSFVAEFQFIKFVVVQGGAGLYLDTGTYPSNADNSAKLGDSFGFHLAAGVDYPVIPKFLSIPIMVRGDFILGNKYESASGNLGGTYIPLSINAGVTFSL